MTDLLNRPATAPGAAPARVASLGDEVRRLEARGIRPLEAGNLAALSVGLRPVIGGWTVAQVEHLRFLRALVSDGRLEP